MLIHENLLWLVLTVPPSVPEELVVSPQLLPAVGSPALHTQPALERRLQADSRTGSLICHQLLPLLQMSQSQSDTSPLCSSPKGHHRSGISSGVTGHPSWAPRSNQGPQSSANCLTLSEVTDAKRVAGDRRAGIALGKTDGIALLLPLPTLHPLQATVRGAAGPLWNMEGVGTSSQPKLRQRIIPF